MYVLGGRSALRLLALLAAVALLALGAASCGSDDDGGDGGNAVAQDQQSDGGPSGDSEPAASDDDGAPSGSDEDQITDLLAKLQTAFKERDVEFICDNVVEAGRKQLKQLENHPTCEKALHDLLTEDATGRRRTNGEPETYDIQTIDIRGNKAIVDAKQPRRKGPQRATLVKQNGQWTLVTWFTSDR